ncbi:MAG TPA: O-acetylhomoserine aminocarboxypropyltransferase/cysteine synthase [Candidatus Pullichristensenella excrementigallinarum]|uniref:O-acetylhomoserine aminocarboxypropyltransferase/cysteine synthase n=1 Tax=Candidatus Pullichristensenella excrementigallinarum TaxID=2840907 RepID=A0A9D1IFG0_9FIRM|nr:O-acetylhomoserine aminocarboxypropyltransferase/cysteine synthase [Candidatus Pullichristensenella excrementigallinarum]
MRIETKCVQEGYRPENGQPRILPIYQSTTYKFDSAEHLGKLFDLEVEGHMYTRISNPTVEMVEKKIASLEGGVGAMCTSSGQAANLLAILNICSAGQNFVCASAIYGGTINLYAFTLKKLGIEARFVTQEMTDAQIHQQFDENTRLVFGETVANPALEVCDIERFARIAHSHNVPLIIDNTFPTPILCRPFEFGCDIVTHSTTKYMDGHASVVGGCIIDSGNFDWAAAGKYPELTEPDESYHGIVYTEKFGKAAYITKARTQLMRDFGSTPQPMAMFLLNLGLETLALRMERHCRNAEKVAAYLEKHEKVEWVNYPGLPSSSQYALAQKYLPNGVCGVISFGVRGGREAAMKFMDALRLAQIVVHVADARTSILHPASTTHRQLTDEQLLAAGIGPEMVRMSIGIENVEDILEDIEQAFNKL